MKIRTLKEAYERWIKALRSGRYNQDQEALRTEDGYCCLGVLLQLRANDGCGRYNSDFEYCYAGRDGGGLGTLPDDFRQSMKISKKNQSKLIVLNDNENASFKTIADYIEKELMPKALEREANGTKVK